MAKCFLLKNIKRDSWKFDTGNLSLSHDHMTGEDATYRINLSDFPFVLHHVMFLCWIPAEKY